MAKLFSAKAHSIIFGGRQLTGFGENDFIEVKFNGDGYNHSVGVDGETILNEDANQSGMITLNIRQGAEANEYLSTIYNAARVGGQKEFNFLMRDQNGTTLYESADCAIKRIPDTTRGRQAGENKWELTCGHLIGFEGKNV